MAANESDGDYLFNPEKLSQIPSWEAISEKLSGQKLVARPLRLGDFGKGYLDLLRQLTEVGQVTKEQYEQRFRLMQRRTETQEDYAIVVLEDIETGLVVGASTLCFELKFIHRCALRGRLEEVVILDTYRGKQLGVLIVRIIVELARDVYKCYKLSLDCTDELVEFYAKNGFKPNMNMVAIKFYE